MTGPETPQELEAAAVEMAGPGAVAKQTDTNLDSLTGEFSAETDSILGKLDKMDV